MTVDSSLWHAQLAHANPPLIRCMQKQERVDGFNDHVLQSSVKCHTCIFGKQTCCTFKPAVIRSTHPLQLVHSDVCGPMQLFAQNGVKYFVTFTNDFSRHTNVFVTKMKSSANSSNL